MPIVQTTVESIEQIIAKSVTVLGTFVVANNALPVIMDLALGKGVSDPIQVKLLLLGAGYAIWTQAIIPFVEDLYNSAKAKATGAKATNAGNAKKYFSLI